jgi:RNA polymerase sigma-70 factor (ECF subfamily)
MRLTEGDVERFVEAHHARLVRAVALSCGSIPVAEDAVQEALAKAWARRRRPDDLTAWVVTVALNHTRSRWRKDRRLTAAPVPDRPAPAELPDLDLHARVAALPRRQREAVVLHYYLGFGVRETAACLGVAEGTIKTALHRARQALAAALTPEEEPAP